MIATHLIDLAGVINEGLQFEQGVVDSNVPSTKSFFISKFVMAAHVPHIVTNLLFVLTSLLTAFVYGAVGTLEVATGFDDVSTLYMMTQVTLADHVRLHGSQCFCSHIDPAKRDLCGKSAKRSPSLMLLKFGFSINIRRRYGLLALADMFTSDGRIDSSGNVANRIFLQLHKSVGSTFCIETQVLKAMRKRFSLFE